MSSDQDIVNRCSAVHQLQQLPAASVVSLITETAGLVLTHTYTYAYTAILVIKYWAQS